VKTAVLLPSYNAIRVTGSRAAWFFKRVFDQELCQESKPG